MIWLARIAVLIAAVTTLYFNGSWAWNNVNANHGKIGFIAMALAIDLCKVTFLGAAAWCWARRFRLRAATLMILWPLAFAASTFMAYASITTQKDAADAITDGKVQDRRRLQDRFERERSALATAQQAPEWSATASCTITKTKAYRQFCANVAELQVTVDDLANMLGPAPNIDNRQDLARLAERTGYSLPAVTFLAAFLPALLLELIASLGSYAVGLKAAPKAPHTRLEAFSDKGSPDPAADEENASGSHSARLAPNPSSVPQSQEGKPRIPKLPKVATG